MGRIVTLNDGRKVHVGGRRRPKVTHPLKLTIGGKYGLDLSQWPTQDASHYSDAPAAQAILRDILGNDSLGDCTIADRFHRQAIREANAGIASPYHPSLDDVIAVYSRCGGYVPGQPATDQGCDETTVLTDCQQVGTTTGNGQVNKIAGWLSVDASNVALVRAVVDAFVGASFCAELAPSWISAMQAGDGFTLGKPTDAFNPDDGHCMTIGDQSASGLVLWSWALRGTLTFDGLAAACDGQGGSLYIVLDQDVIGAASAKAPDLLDWSALQTDFNSLPQGAMTPAAP